MHDHIFICKTNTQSDTKFVDVFAGDFFFLSLLNFDLLCVFFVQKNQRAMKEYPYTRMKEEEKKKKHVEGVKSNNNNKQK